LTPEAATSAPATPTAEAAIPTDVGVAQLEAASSLPVPDPVDTTSLAALAPLQYGDLRRRSGARRMVSRRTVELDAGADQRVDRLP